MNEEEKQAIKYFYNLRATIDESNMLFDEDINIKCGKEMIKQITTVLNLLEKKDEIIKNQSYTNKKMRKKLQGYRKLLKLKERQLQKKDKQIDLMAEDIAFSEEINSYEDIKTYKKKIKQYFERKVDND